MTRKERIHESVMNAFLATGGKLSDLLPKLHKAHGYGGLVEWKTGDGRFRVTRTDNSNARRMGRRPKWTVTDTKPVKVPSGADILKYGRSVLNFAELDTLLECREWIKGRLKREEAKSEPEATNATTN